MTFIYKGLGDLADALEALFEIDDNGWYMLGSSLTCREMAIIGDVLREIGYGSAFSALLQGHGESDDDPDDAHHDIYLEHHRD